MSCALAFGLIDVRNPLLAQHVADLVAVFADDKDRFLCTQLHRSIERILSDRLADQGVQDLAQLRFHARTLACSEDYCG